MAGRKPLLEHELPGVYAALEKFPQRDAALVTLGLNTGFRISEILSLNVGDVWDGVRIRPQVKVTRARMKGGHGVRRKAITSRIVPLNETVSESLRKYLFGRFGSGLGPAGLDEPLFPSRFHGIRLTRWRANVIVHEVLSKVGIDGNGDYGTHSLRKTFCRAIYKGTSHDLNLTRAVMGHTNCSTTQKYLHVDDEEMTNAVLALGNPA